ncbi:MAG TPA: GAF domain-containing sensor histidine kinase [Candidatus Limnocylindrales bacterium]|nr:GAF domain-containing sensor histidine kinase [Candidatus Limnocylindrales bacterium]
MVTQPTGGTARPSRDTTFPVVVALEALDAWLQDPSPRRRVWLGEALAAIVRAAGAVGAYLEVDAPPMPAFTVGFGTLSTRPPDERRPGIGVHPLSADDGRIPIGTLWLDTAAVDGDFAARALELALDAAWARASVRRTAERLEALDAATRAIAGVLDVELVLQLIVDRVRDLVGARYAALGIVDDIGRIERFITSGVTAEERARIGDLPRGHGLLGLIIREERSIRTPDIAAHPASSGFPPNHPPMRSFLGVPVTVKGGAIGNLYLTDKQGSPEFDEADQHLVEMFALHAGIAIENARLHDQVQRLAVVEERERIGQDLHDGIIQGMYAIALSLEDVPDLMRDDADEATARIDRAIDGLNLTIRDIRNFILGLHSELIGGGDLVAGLATLAHEFRLNSMIEIEADLEGGEPAASGLPIESRVQLLQMAREALSNAARHSRASRARIELSSDDEWLTLRIEDNGVGFDPDATRDGRHLGLVNLRGRAAALGGSLAIDSRPGDGASIIVRLPRPRPIAARPSEGSDEQPPSVSAAE